MHSAFPTFSTIKRLQIKFIIIFKTSVFAVADEMKQ